MRTLVFNIAVAAALVYLVTGGKVPLDGLMARLQAAPTAQASVAKAEPIPAPKPVAEEAPKTAPAPKPVAEVAPVPELKPEPKSEAKPVPQALAPLPRAETVAADPGHVIDESKAQQAPAPKLAMVRPQVAPKPVAKPTPANAAPSVPALKVEEGAQLMTPSQRVKALQGLADDLETMYLERSNF